MTWAFEKYASTTANHISGSNALNSGIRIADANVTLLTVLGSAAPLCHYHDVQKKLNN
jgi:hypothetical protein